MFSDWQNSETMSAMCWRSECVSHSDTLSSAKHCPKTSSPVARSHPFFSAQSLSINMCMIALKRVPLAGSPWRVPHEVSIPLVVVFLLVRNDNWTRSSTVLKKVSMYSGDIRRSLQIT